MIDQVLLFVGLALILAGFALTLIAATLLALAAVKRGGRVRGGGAVVIGLFPVVFGTDREAVKVLLILSIALVALLLILTVFSAKIFG